MIVRSLAAAVSALLVVCSFIHAQDQACSFRYPEGRCGKGELRYINGLPVLTVAGTPEEIGEAVGALAVNPGRKMLDYPEDVLRDYHLHALWKPLMRTCRAMAERFPDDFAREMDGIIRGGRTERDPIIAGNTLFDVKKLFACSALLVGPDRSATGTTLVGRNLDYPSLGYAHQYSLVTVYHPAGARHAFVSVGFPGLVGCVSGMNDAGLTVAILESFQARVGVTRFDRRGTPYALCYRRLLEECATVEEATTLLATMHRATMTNLILADKKTIAVAEVTPEYIVVRGPEHGCCVFTNHFCTEKLKPIIPVNITHSWQRYDILERVADCDRPLGLIDIQKGLNAVRDDEEALQAMIFEPAPLRLHLAIGRCPATTAEMRVLDLAPLFHPAP